VDEPALTIPGDFARTIIDVHGEAGVEWLGKLPALLADCAQRWSLTPDLPFAPLSYNYVLPALRADGARVVLKAGVPERELLAEIEALRLFDGRGSVRLLDADPDRGVLLLERIEPGTPLTAVFDAGRDEEATAAAAAAMRRLWRPAPPAGPFPSVADWARGLTRLRSQFAGGSGPLPAALVDQAEQLFAELIGSMDEPVLLHGDLHHGNILAAGRAPWLAIDPKGVVGEPAYEAGALLRNPMPRILEIVEPRRLLTRRIDQLGEALGLDRVRLRGWGIAQAVLSAWWSLEDHGRGWEEAIACAEHLAMSGV
jgi:streptomycin 6-kinase